MRWTRNEGLHHVGITVSNLDRSLAFYLGLLGGRSTGRWERRGPAIDAVTGQTGAVVHQSFVELPGTPALLELLEYVGSTAAPLDPDNARAGAVHLAVLVTDLDERLARLAEYGGHALSSPIVGGPGPMEGSRLVYVLDPDNVRVELVEPPPPLSREAIPCQKPYGRILR